MLYVKSDLVGEANCIPSNSVYEYEEVGYKRKMFKFSIVTVVMLISYFQICIKTYCLKLNVYPNSNFNFLQNMVFDKSYCISMHHLNFFFLIDFILIPSPLQIKFLKSKEGCAMIQMGDPLAVERAVTNLNGSTFFNSKLQLG